MRTCEARTWEKYINNRRILVVALGASGLAVALGSFAQPKGKVWRVGFLGFTGGPDESIEAFREQLRTLGYVEGSNLAIEYRWAAGKEERVPELAAELVRLQMDVIVTRATFVALAVKRATSTIPIVMASASDPVGAGVIASLAHPGGNVTGVTLNSTEIVGKRLQLLGELVPKATRVAALVWENSPVKQSFVEEIRTTARQMGITLIPQEVSTTEALVGAFDAMQREHAQALIVQASPFATNNRKRIAELAAQQRLPTMFELRAFMDEGGFVSYGPDGIELHRRAAYYVDRILKGTKPADLPVEQPTKYELIINVRTAKALGINVPDSILVRADNVIE
jgi:putative tryptophan/tyrosine transport system substrate-binding protein